MAVMQVGFSASKTYTPDSYTSVTVGFWSVDEVHMKRSIKQGYVTMVGYTDKATFLANAANYYPKAVITFRFNSGNWPFVVGTDPATKFFQWVATQSAVADDDGNEINGGIDWSAATVETITV
jgi:hypothetical protein